MKVKRGDKIYEVLQREGNEVQVQETFDYSPDCPCGPNGDWNGEPHGKEHTHTLQMWWELRHCEIIEE